MDAADALSKGMANGLPDPVRFFGGISRVVEGAAKAAKSQQPRVVLCSESAALLLAEGKADAAIRFEQLANDLAETQGLDLLCAYPLSNFDGKEFEHAFQSICAEHSGAYSQ